MQLTEAQQQIVEAPVSDLLVSAAAGSGKTAVMTERIVSRIVQGDLDISRVLVMTFTDAAARQMKEKIEQKLSHQRQQAIDPQTRQHLKSQQALLTGAAISTIHAFCLTVVKNFSHLAVDDEGRLMLEPGFATADASQADLLLQETLDDVLSARYLLLDTQPPAERPWSEDFLRLVNSFSDSRSDRPLRGQLLKLFYYLRSLPDYPAQVAQFRRQIADNARNFDGSRQAEVLKSQLKLLVDRACSAIPELLALLDDGLELVRDKQNNSDRRAQFRQAFAVLLDVQQLLGSGSPSWDELVARSLAIGELKAPQNRQKAAPELRRFVALLREQVAEAIHCLTGQWNGDTYRDHFLFDTRFLFQQTAGEIEAELAAMEPVLNQLFDLTLELDTAYRQKKARHGLIDFADFEHFALQILRQPEAAAYYRNRFLEIYIDEYQDTSSIQGAVVAAIGRDNVFMVGDVKQSIYRFRHARPQLFISRAESYRHGAPAQLRTLSSNFRSVPGVLAAVNEVFAQLMSKAAGELDYDASQALQATRPAPAPEPPVHLWLLSSTDVTASGAADDSNLDDREAEAGSPAAPANLGPDDTEREGQATDADEPAWSSLQSLPGEVGDDLPDLGDLTNYEREAQAVRGEIERLLAAGRNPADIVILARTRSLVRVFAQALAEAGVDALEETGQRLFDSPQLRLLVALLQVMDNPLQDVPLAAVLRSSLVAGGFPPADLLRIRIAARQAEKGASPGALDLRFFHQAVRWYITEGPEDSLRRRLQDFWTWLEHWREREKTQKIGDWLNLLLESTGYLNQVAALPSGTERLREIRALVDWTYTFERTRQRGLFDLVRFIEKLQQSGLAESPFALEISTREAIRVMTIHRSKGLEFPVVFLVGLTARITPKEQRDAILFSENLGIGFDWIDPDLHQRHMTHLKLAMLAENKAAGLAEELRLLYVAMTRARDQLYLTALLPGKIPEALVRRFNQASRQPGLALRPELVLSCTSYLDWLLVALARHPGIDLSRLLPAGDVDEPGYRLPEPSTAAWDVRVLAWQDLLRPVTATGPVAGPAEPEAAELCRFFSDHPAVPEPLIAAAVARISAPYAYPAAARRPIKLSVSELKRLEQQESQYGEEQTLDLPTADSAAPTAVLGINFELRPLQGSRESLQPALQPATQQAEQVVLLTGAELGTALHSYLRYLDLTAARAVAGQTPADDLAVLENLKRQLEDLTAWGVLSDLESRSIASHLASVASFIRSDLARRMQQAAETQHLYREMPFTLAVPAQGIWPLDQGFAADDQALVQGIIDGWFIEGSHAVLFDYKTDRLTGDPMTIRATLLKRYARQLGYYARAISQATRLPVTEHCIVHLPSRQVLTYPADELAAAFPAVQATDSQEDHP